MKFGFVTCVKLGLSCIEEIYKSGFSLDIVITLNDNQAVNKSGRVFLDKICFEHNIKLLKIDNINDEKAIEFIKNNSIDWLFIIGWSQIAKNDILNSTKFGVIGAHPTLLPDGRGRASIPWTILKGIDKTGVSFFKLDEGVDTGDIIHQEIISVDKKEDAQTLYEKVNLSHIKGISEVIEKLKSNSLKLIKQDNSLSTYWPGRENKDGEIDLNKPISIAEKLIRATTKPYPGAFVKRKNKKIIIWKAKIVDKSINDVNNRYLFFKDGILLLKEYEESMI